MLSALRRTIQKIPVAMKMEDSPIAFTAILKITRLYQEEMYLSIYLALAYKTIHLHKQKAPITSLHLLKP
jgi:hypothetical protein